MREPQNPQRRQPARSSVGRDAGAPRRPLGDGESRRIAREELEVNLLVEAGAGSGKTQLLAERMASGVGRGSYQIDRMAAVTFTRKAGSELRGRFHLALEAERTKAEALEDEAVRAERLERLDGALANLERFFAGTIHSFCARLLRERPVEAGVSPGFTELDEVQDAELRRRVLRDFVAIRRNEGDPDMVALLATGVRPRDLDAGFATVCLHEDVEFPPGDGQPPETAQAKASLLEFWGELERELPREIAQETTCSVQKAARELRALMRAAPARLDRPDVLADVLKSFESEPKITQKYWAESAAEKKRINAWLLQRHREFREATVTPWLTRWRQYVYRLALTLLAQAREYAAAERRRLNTLNYSDLLILTARVLRENAGVRHALQRKYRHLFVDEFQDTDPVQAEIVFLLAADEELTDWRTRLRERRVRPQRGRGASIVGPTLPGLLDDDAPPSGPADWRTVPLRPGALFVVGDPKQSIYRFRRADIDIYTIVRDRLTAAGRVLPLTMNFRSVPALCEWANGVFRTCFPEEPTRHAPKFAPLDPYVREHDERDAGLPRRSAAKGGAEAGLLSITHVHAKGAEVIDADAERIAAYIRAEVDAGRRAFKDFLILTRKKNDRIAPYAAALEALNIPVEVSGAGAFGDSAEVRALAALLRALADPYDPVALVAVLRGPLFGLSDPELFEYRQSGGWFSMFADPMPEDSVSAALGMLGEYHRLTRMLPAAAALERMLEATGYLALASTTPGGVEAGDLIHAVDRVRAVVEEGGSLADAGDALVDAGVESNEVESLPLEPGRTDVVRVMNLHKAKGLEADVVFLADPCGGVQNEKVDVHVQRDGDRARGWFRLVAKAEGQYNGKVLGEHPDWPAHAEAELSYLQAEEHRLLYVAATRAREALVVSRWAGETKSAAWGLLNGFLDRARELAVPATVVAPAPEPDDTAAALEAAFSAGVDAAKASARTPSWSIDAVTSEARHIARITRAGEEPAEDQDPTKVVRADTPAHRADAGMVWGTLMHGLLEHAMRYPLATRDDLRRLGLWLTVEEPQLRRSLDDAIDTVLRVAKAPFWREAQAGEHHEEAPFTVVRAGAAMNGVIDLLYASPEGWRVRDYKTDVALEPQAYAGQLKAYRRALEVVGLPVADAELVHVREGEET